MNHLNSIILEGNLVEDILISAKGIRFTIAVSRTFKNSNGENEEEVSYFDIEAYGSMAEMLSDRLKKGRGVRIVGRMAQSRWTDADGKVHSRGFVVAEHIEIKPFADKEGEKCL